MGEQRRRRQWRRAHLVGGPSLRGGSFARRPSVLIWVQVRARARARARGTRSEQSETCLGAVKVREARGQSGRARVSHAQITAQPTGLPPPASAIACLVGGEVQLVGRGVEERKRLGTSHVERFADCPLCSFLFLSFPFFFPLFFLSWIFPGGTRGLGSARD